MVPVVTLVLQIADTCRSLREAANVTRLTNLALLFVPLSFVAHVFSMNGGVTRHDLAIYFAGALPLCAVVLLQDFQMLVSGKLLITSKRHLGGIFMAEGFLKSLQS